MDLTDGIGYKFETLSLLSDTWAATPREVIDGREDEVVNNHAQYVSVVRTGIGKAKMIIGGEVDAGKKISSRASIEPDPSPGSLGLQAEKQGGPNQLGGAEDVRDGSK